MNILKGKWKAYRLVFAMVLLCHFHGKSQIEIQPARLDFGTTNEETEWVVDVHISNKNDKKDFLLSANFSHEYEVLYTSKMIEVDSTITMRVKFIPREKGAFSEDIQLYFASSTTPFIIPVRAMVDYRNPQENIPCPDFSRLAADCCADNMFIVEVVDADTGLPVEDATIRIMEQDITRMKILTNATGKVSQAIPIGYYRLFVSHKDYTSNEVTSYINHRKAYFKIPIKRVVKADTLAMQPVPSLPEVKAEDSDFVLLPEDQYKPNNFVFLLDVSSSMSQGEKLLLMKRALNQLILVLRSGDKITLISYADDSKTILPATSGNEKEKIKTLIEDIQVGGSTSGAKGFKSAYKALKNAQIDNGNNQLVVITDGVFQPADQFEINKLVKKSAKKKFITSIVGIQCASFAILKLTELTSMGNGSFLLVEDENDLNVLIDEMKKRSLK